MVSRGLRNNNPLNIRKSKDKFQGEKDSTDSAFKQFVSMAYGYRAAFVILYTYLQQGKNTVDRIIRSWAPANDGNNTANYISHVERRSGVDRYLTLNERSGSEYIKIVAAMSRSENGVDADMEQVKAGFNLQNKIKL